MLKKKTDVSSSPKRQKRKEKDRFRIKKTNKQTTKTLLEEGTSFYSTISAFQLNSELRRRETVSNGIKVMCKDPRAF